MRSVSCSKEADCLSPFVGTFLAGKWPLRNTQLRRKILNGFVPGVTNESLLAVASEALAIVHSVYAITGWAVLSVIWWTFGEWISQNDLCYSLLYLITSLPVFHTIALIGFLHPTSLSPQKRSSRGKLWRGGRLLEYLAALSSVGLSFFVIYLQFFAPSPTLP